GEVVLWGTGKARREFLFSDDMGEACVRLMTLAEGEYTQLLAQGDWPLLNVGCGEDQTVAELAGLVAEVVGFKGRLVFDATMPDGTPIKLLDVSRLAALGWRQSIGLREGLALAYADFLRRVVGRG
ncbi:MAG: NAD-dependent epimerase/dehydratase family protein, partial [Humidesulfovibrio sp.]|nr:NAD-dependent epimerase/dehydratase family protein [Humidesulfovibrio sp.]